MIDLKQGDCLELMKEIPDNSIDMVLCDLPYGTIKGMQLSSWTSKTTEWDNRLPLDALFKQYERLIKNTGAIVLFSQEPFTQELRTLKPFNLSFSYPMIWLKDSWGNGLYAKKAPLNVFEDINVFRKVHSLETNRRLREYSKAVLDYIGKKAVDVEKEMGNERMKHFFHYKSPQFSLPTKQTYSAFVNKYNLRSMPKYQTYEKMKNSFDKRLPTFNLCGENHLENVFVFSKDKEHYHPTQKPVKLLEKLIRIYSNKGELVLDNTMGSGSTGVACVNTKRDFIGMELDEEYFHIAEKRIREAQAEIRLDIL
ncbi:DNA modification methylase [Ligilactobacillus salitolerans]|uniref:Methyltransferase n=1 Tax=Ligilactobacillus salitolerans TaxID=1808352 RepID=A0A401IT16_9LACO|nr:DNA methyltransferase [Ligilactobacillus salitolerans]GBG94635.1 DNA modification methylase [Ligilactobacillus salitolerans]